MSLWTESGINWYLERLASNDAWKISGALYTVADIGRLPQPQPTPTGNAEVITYLEQLIEDNRLCPVDWRIPYAFSELRWLAARVLACEYAYQDVEKPIILEDVVQPIRRSDAYSIALSHRVNLQELFEQGRLPTKTEIIKPQDYAYCCSKEAIEERKRNEIEDN